MQTNEAQVVWRFMNLSIDFVTRLLFQMFVYVSLLAGFSSFVSRPTARSTAENNGMKSFFLHFVKMLLAKVSCLYQ